MKKLLVSMAMIFALISIIPIGSIGGNFGVNSPSNHGWN